MKLDHIYNKPCGDLREISDDSIDVVVTSPPYNLSEKKSQRNKLHNMTGYDGFDDDIQEDQYQEQQIQLLNDCCRVIKKTGSIFYVHKPRHVDGIEISPHSWIDRSDCILYQTIIWNRKSTHNHDPRHQWPIHEYIFHLVAPDSKPRLRQSCAEWTSIWSINFSETRNNAHPAPFPLKLVLRCLQWCDPPPGGIVLDPYMGSGTTAVVAVEEGLHFVGYEISKNYISIAHNRIATARPGCGLFDTESLNDSPPRCVIPDIFDDDDQDIDKS